MSSDNMSLGAYRTNAAPTMEGPTLVRSAKYTSRDPRLSFTWDEGSGYVDITFDDKTCRIPADWADEVASQLAEAASEARHGR